MEEKMTFETAITRLEEIVRLLERGEIPVEEALGLFEEGAGLMKKCATILDKAEQKVNIIMKGEQGEPTSAPFDIQEENQ
ncbi:MAG: exodeoxyribonuclease VII small subunit [Eubacteriales bacterium]|jgi:exodeoxyribonuclease VII small subunit